MRGEMCAGRRVKTYRQSLNPVRENLHGIYVGITGPTTKDGSALATSFKF